MQDWASLMREIRQDIWTEKTKGSKEVSFDTLLNYLSQKESEYIENDKWEILEKINHKNDNSSEYMDKIRDFHVRNISATYDKGSAYTSLIIGAGYASFFGLWSLVNKDLLPTIKIWSALLLCISVCFFVFFEVYKTVMTSYNVFKWKSRLDLASKTLTAREHYELLEKDETDESWINIGYYPAWIITTIIAILTAIISVGLIIYNFIYILCTA